MRNISSGFVIGTFMVLGAVVVLVVAATGRPAADARRRAAAAPLTLSTSRQALDAVIDDARARVAADPGNGEAAVLLADALMRAARVQSDPTLAVEAEHVLRATLAHDRSDYAARRMLGVVYLSQHRFAAALEAANAARELRPEDAWNHAVMGDALIELGRYDEAFDAFDQVMARRPDAAAYARVAYARELQGDLDGAVALMRMAADATGPHDPEAQAWAFAQLANLYVLQGKLDLAERELRRGEFTFPSHPYVLTGRIRLALARRQYPEALRLVETAAETPETAAIRGDLLVARGDGAGAEAAYQEAERLEREGWKHEEPQPAALARLLAERGRGASEAVSLAERAARDRADIHTMDALAWAYFRAGRVEAAAAAMRQALRTGTRDPRIRCHASAIAARQAGVTPASCHPLDVVAAEFALEPAV